MAHDPSAAISLIEQRREILQRKILTGTCGPSDASLESRMVAYRAAVNTYNELGVVCDELRKLIKDDEQSEVEAPPTTPSDTDPFEEEDL